MKIEKKQEFLDKYSENLFNIGQTCLDIGISRHLYYSWYNGDEDFRQQIDNFREFFIDMAENALIKAIKKGDTDSAKFVVKHLGKKRGYVEKLDITSNGESINTIKLIEIKKQDGAAD